MHVQLFPDHKAPPHTRYTCIQERLKDQRQVKLVTEQSSEEADKLQDGFWLIITYQIIHFLFTELRSAVLIGHFYQNENILPGPKLAAQKLDPAGKTRGPAVRDTSTWPSGLCHLQWNLPH